MSLTPSEVAFQPGPFEKVSVYDAPEVLASSIIDGELSASTLSGLAFAPARLTPAERDTYVTRLQQAAGGGVAGALIDVALNPWVWGLFLFSPAGAQALSSGRGLFTVAKGKSAYSEWAGPLGGMLKNLGLSTSLQVLRGTRTSAALQQAERTVQKMAVEWDQVTHEAREKVLKRFGLKNLDHLHPDHGRDVAARHLAREIETNIQMYLEKWDKTVISHVFRKNSVRVDEVQRNPLVTTNMRKKLLDMADGDTVLLEYADRVRDAMNLRLLRTFGKDTPENVQRVLNGVTAKQLEGMVDEEKVFKAFASLQKNRLFGPTSAYEGLADVTKEFVRQVFHADITDEMIEQIQSKKYTPEQFMDTLKKMFFVEDAYFPRNVRGVVETNSGRYITDDTRSIINLQRAISPGRTQSPRVRKFGNYSPEDYRYVREDLGHGVTDEFLELEESAVNAMSKAIEAGTHATFLRLAPHRSINRYARDTSVARAFHTEAYDGVTRLAAKETGLGIPKNPILPKVDGSIADLIADDFGKLKDPYARRTISHFLIPSISGLYRPQNLISVQSMLDSKRSLSWLTKSKFGEVIKGFGPRGEKFIDELEELANPSFGIDSLHRPGLTSRALAKYFYVTHLGINMASIVLNSTQPFLLGAVWLGASNVAKAYPAALKEMWGYASERAAMGFKPLSFAERTQLVRKHFKYADVEGENLLGFGGNPFESAEALVNLGSDISSRPGRLQQFSEFMMKGFEKAEWLNRNVTAHAVERLYQSKNLPTFGNPAFIRDVREGIMETQFSGALMNTPLFMASDDAMLSKTGPLFVNPLMRQFLQFPIRSFTGAFSAGPKLGGRENFGRAMLGDLWRGMGISAIGYEVSKDLLGADMERATFFNASTEILGAERIARSGSPVPLPPVIDIPVSFIRSFSTGDFGLYQRTLPRLLPGGISIARALGSAPDIGLPSGVDLQRTYADWGVRTPDGRVPLFQRDGSLIDFQSPAALILKGVGADLGAFRDATEVDRFLVTNRDRMVAMRRQAIDALITGNMSRYKEVKAEFERRFKIPLVVDQRRIKANIRTRTIPRTERILDTLPPEARPIYQRTIAAAGTERLGIEPDELQQVASSSKRARIQTVSPPQQSAEDPSEQAQAAGFMPFTPP